jgi:hypothetical protein
MATSCGSMQVVNTRALASPRAPAMARPRKRGVDGGCGRRRITSAPWFTTDSTIRSQWRA